MESTKRFVILLIIVLLTVHAAPSAEKPSAGISGTRFASCLVKVTYDSAMLPLNLDTLLSLLNSSSVRGKAVSEVLGLPPDTRLKLFSVPSAKSELQSVPPTQPPGKVVSPPAGYDALDLEGEQMMYGENLVNEMLKERSAATRRRPTARYRRGSSRIRSRSSDVVSSLLDELVQSRRRSVPESPTSPGEQTILFQLQVELPEEVRPAAWEFMSALVDNLQKVLAQAYDEYAKKLDAELMQAVSQHEEAQLRLSDTIEQVKATVQPRPPVARQDPADVLIYQQLEQVVDFSQWTPKTPFGEAVEQLKGSVDPTLKIVVLWRDLLDNADIEPTTPINMEGVPEVRLGTALELLLKAVSGEFAKLGYDISDGVITVATADSLSSKLVTCVYEVPGLIHGAVDGDTLAELIKSTVEPDSWVEAGGWGDVRIGPGKNLVAVQTPDVHRKISDFLAHLEIEIPADIPADIPVEMLLEDKQELLRDKQRLEMEVARLDARRSAIEKQIAEADKQAAEKIRRDAVTAELQKLLDIQVQQLERTKKLYEQGRLSLAQIGDTEEKLARARIELARRREELSKTAGGDSLIKFNNQLADIMIELTEKKAELQVLRDQFKQMEKQLTMATAYDPQLLKLRLAKQRFETASRRADELDSRLTYMRPPTVTIIGVSQEKKTKF